MRRKPAGQELAELVRFHGTIGAIGEAAEFKCAKSVFLNRRGSGFAPKALWGASPDPLTRWKQNCARRFKGFSGTQPPPRPGAAFTEGDSRIEYSLPPGSLGQGEARATSLSARICEERTTKPWNKMTAARRVALLLASGVVAPRSQPHFGGCSLGAPCQKPRATQQTAFYPGVPSVTLRHAAIHEQFRAGDIGGVRGRKKSDGLGDFRSLRRSARAALARESRRRVRSSPLPASPFCRRSAWRSGRG